MIREWPNFFLVKCEMACVFLMNCDFITSREPYKFPGNKKEVFNLCRTVILVVFSIILDSN